jgi:hypothetical protein
MLGMHRRQSPPSEDAPRQPRVSQEVRASIHPDGVVLIHLGTGNVFTTNRIGAAIWIGLTDGWTNAAIIRLLTTEFNVARATAQRDADEFLRQLTGAGLLTNA